MYLTGFGIDHNGSVAKISYVIWTALVIKEQIPVTECIIVVVKIADNVMGVFFTDLYGVKLTEAIFVTTLGENYLLIGMKLMEYCEVFKMVAPVPMTSNAIDIF